MAKGLFSNSVVCSMTNQNHSLRSPESSNVCVLVKARLHILAVTAERRLYETNKKLGESFKLRTFGENILLNFGGY
jgi:hypothetical protein